MKFRLLYHGSERRLSPGSFLIGRSPDCAIVLEDPLVSRHHARLTVTDDAVLLEDLKSRNGVLLNGIAIEEPRNLQDGDEIGIMNHRLVLGVGSVKSGFSTTAPDGAATRPAEMFGVLGALAEKALALGHGEEAQRILGSHLSNVLDQLLRGDRPEDQVLRQAISYGARLAAATRRGYWFAYVFQLLGALGHACPAEILDELYSGAGRAEAPDLKAIRDYIAMQRQRLASMTPRERFLLNRVEGLERLWSA